MTPNSARQPGVHQAQFPVFLAGNVERDLVRLENRQDVRRFLTGLGVIYRALSAP